MRIKKVFMGLRISSSKTIADFQERTGRESELPVAA